MSVRTKIHLKTAYTIILCKFLSPPPGCRFGRFVFGRRTVECCTRPQRETRQAGGHSYASCEYPLHSETDFKLFRISELRRLLQSSPLFLNIQLSDHICTTERVDIEKNPVRNSKSAATGCQTVGNDARNDHRAQQHKFKSRMSCGKKFSFRIERVINKYRFKTGRAEKKPAPTHDDDVCFSRSTERDANQDARTGASISRDTRSYKIR